MDREKLVEAMAEAINASSAAALPWAKLIDEAAQYPYSETWVRFCRNAARAVLPLAVAEEREQCAKVADLYEKELTRMAVDTWMCDPIRTGDNSPAAQERSLELGEEGWRKGERAETARHIADAIRSRGEPR